MKCLEDRDWELFRMLLKSLIFDINDKFNLLMRDECKKFLRIKKVGGIKLKLKLCVLFFYCSLYLLMKLIINSIYFLLIIK